MMVLVQAAKNRQITGSRAGRITGLLDRRWDANSAFYVGVVIYVSSVRNRPVRPSSGEDGTDYGS